MKLSYHEGRNKYDSTEYQSMRLAKIRQIQGDDKKGRASKPDPTDLSSDKSKEALIKLAFDVNRSFGTLDNQQMLAVLKEIGRGVLLIQSF
jgi:hypothetical protein